MDYVSSRQRAARLLTDALNPFSVFTALFVLVALSESSGPRAILYLGAELAAAACVVGYILLLRRRRRVEGFWISARGQRAIPSLVLLVAFIALLSALALLGSPTVLLLTTLSMGLASASIAALTLFWKASAHSTVAGHAAAAGLIVLGPLMGLLFVLVLPAVLWARVSSGAHTLPQTLAGAGVGVLLAVAFLA